MAWIIDMEDYRAGFNRTAAEEQIEITDAVAWAKDKLNFEADAAQPKFSQRAPNEASSTARANGVSPRRRRSVVLVASPSLRQSAEFLKKRLKKP